MDNLEHGARVVVYINNKVYGKVVSFSWTSTSPRKKIHCIDVPVPLEIAPTTTDVTFQMEILRVVGDGGAQDAGLVAQQNEISREKYYTLVIIDRAFNYRLFECNYCQTESETWTIAAKSVMRGSINGSGIAWTNEAAFSTQGSK